MKTAHDPLDKLKTKNPFTVPEGYLEGLTERIMEKLPEPVRENTRPPVTLYARIKPLFYLAAVFAGLLLFFKFFFGMPEQTNAGRSVDSLLVQTAPPAVHTVFYTTTAEDEEYLDYVEEQCANYILEGEIDF